MPQTSHGYPYPAISDAPDGPGQLQALAEAVNDDTRFADTGWVACTVSKGNTGSAKVRRVGDIVYFRGLVQRSGGWSPSTFTDLLVVPVGFECVDTTRIPLAGFGRAGTSVDQGASGNFLAITSGNRTIQIGQNGIAYGSAYLAGVSYPAA